MCRVATPFYQLPAYHVYSFLRNLLYLITHLPHWVHFCNSSEKRPYMSKEIVLLRSLFYCRNKHFLNQKHEVTLTSWIGENGRVKRGKSAGQGNSDAARKAETERSRGIRQRWRCACDQRGVALQQVQPRDVPCVGEAGVGNQGVDRRQRRDAEEGGYVDFAVVHQQYGVFAALNQQLAE